MGATVVNALTSGYWAKSKPADYKGAELEKALKTYEGVAGKTVNIPNNLIPKTPNPKVKEINDCITELKNAITELTKGADMLGKIVTAAQGVQGAASKTAADLRKLAKGKDCKDPDAYENAAASAESIGAAAADALKKVQ